MKQVLKKHLVHVLVAVVYYATARLGLMLAYPGTNATPLWFPTGIALSAVLIRGYGMWPGIALGAFAANLQQLAGLGLSLPASFAAALGTSAGNTMEALVGAYVIRRKIGLRDPFGTSADVITFLAYGALLSTMISATIGAMTFSLSASDWSRFASIWMTWWLGDAAGAILIVPLMMTYATSEFLSRFTAVGITGNFLSFFGIVAVWYVVFVRNYPLIALLIPVVIFSANYMGRFNTAVAVFLLSGLSTFSTIRSSGPFASYPLNESLLLQQGFTGSIAMAAMVLAAHVYEQKNNAVLLSERDRYNRMLFESSVVGLALCRLDGALVDVNAAFARIIGRTVEETLKLSYWDITPKKYAFQEQVQIDSLYATGRYGPYEKEYIHKDGRLIPVRLQGLLISKGNEQFIWSSAEDISERSKMEQELRVSEERYRDLYEKNPLMLFTVAPSGTVLSVNRRGAEQLGYAVEDLVGNSVLNVFLDDDKPTAAKHLAECVAHPDGIFQWELRKLRKDGGMIWVQETSYTMRNAAGSIVVLIVCENITERKRLEEERQLFVSLANNSKEFIGMADLTLTPFYANSAALKLIGLPDSEALRKIKVQDVFFPEDRPFITDEFLPGVLRDGNGEVEVRFRHFQTNEAIWVLYNVFAIYDTHGKTAGWATVSRNINERKRAELELTRHREHLEDLVKERTADLRESQKALMNIVEDLNQKTHELEQANARLQELDRLKSLFIASMSHELRTPLNSIIGFTGILLQGLAGELNDEQRKQLGMVKSSSQHLLSLITDIIDLSKIEAGKIDLKHEPFDVSGVVREVVDSFRVIAAQKGLALSSDVPAGLSLMGDAVRVRQVLVNLVGNAVKFTERGSVLVAARPGNDSIELSVTDTGRGIRREDMGKLFQFFSQVVSPDAPKHEGTGLGLYLSKKLVMLLGGEIRAESDIGAGSSFIFTLPMK